MKLESEVLAVIDASRTEGNALYLPLQLDRKLYLKTDKALEAAGGVWNRKAKAHLFPIDAESAVEGMLLTGSIVIPKDDFEFFPTPPAVVELLMWYADIQPGMTCLEPQAGGAAIARAMRDRGGFVQCVELNPAAAQCLEDDGYPTLTADFLSLDPTSVPGFDRIVLNPPFSRSRDILHTVHAVDFLKPGGKLVGVLGAGASFRTDAKHVHFRDLVAERGGTIKPLPEGSFKASGTSVNTVMVVIPC